MTRSLLRKRKLSIPRLVALLLFVVIALVLGRYFLSGDSDDVATEMEARHVPEPPGTYTELLPETSGDLPGMTPVRMSTTIGRGDSFFKIMQSNGIPHLHAADILQATKEVFDFSKVLPGHELVLIFSSDTQQLIGIEYEISDLRRLRVCIAEDSIEATMEHIERIFNPSYEGELKQVDFTIQKGDNLSSILGSVGVCAYQIDALIKSVKKEYNLSSLVPERLLSVWITDETPPKLAKLCYEIDALNFVDVVSEGGGFIASRRALELDIGYERAEGTISSSLYESAVKAGVSPELVMALSDIFAWDINFFSDIREGDSFTVLYETYSVEGAFKGYGKVLAARFINQGREHVAIYYNDNNGISGYYNDQGNPIRKLFLKAPLNYRRISSGFSYNRMHPVFHVARPHLGVDYAAPTGTPVVALGNGKVIFKGVAGGFGNSIQIKHPNGYITYYGHLSRYAKGLHKGKNVSQGEVIGYVGMTGVATGPHLDFRVKHNGKFINPLRLTPVTGPPLKGDNLVQFKDVAVQRRAMLDDPSLNNATKLSTIE